VREGDVSKSWKELRITKAVRIGLETTGVGIYRKQSRANTQQAAVWVRVGAEREKRRIIVWKGER